MNYSRREKKWKIYHSFEDRNKKFFLAKLTARKSFRILSDLYLFSQQFAGMGGADDINMNKINALAKIHSLFGKIKS